jgi:hypothetical protein
MFRVAPGFFKQGPSSSPAPFRAVYLHVDQPLELLQHIPAPASCILPTLPPPTLACHVIVPTLPLVAACALTTLVPDMRYLALAWPGKPASAHS